MSAAFPCRPAGFLQLFFLVSILFLVPSIAAPVTEDLSQTEQGQISEYYGGESKKCYYNFQHYEEGDRIITNEPCLNCTCHKRMLMCYLRVCPFTKAIGQDCKVEKKPDQCCPVITCPEVPVQLLTSSTTEHPTTSSSTKTAVAHPDNHGCRLENNSFYPDGAQLPIAPNNPCELCYCIRNRTACVMQECTLNVEGCRPVYQDGVCCPVRYDCDYYDVSTTERPTTGGLQLTPTPVPLGCRYGNTIYNDGEKIETDKPCESCYCMRGDIVCAVRSCGTPLQGKNCEPLPPPEGECCPTNYKCANGTVPVESLSEETATASTYTLHVDDASTDHPEQQLADNVEHDFPEHNGEEEEVHEEKPSAPSEPETESSTSITSDSEKPTDQTAETAQHEEQVQQVSQVEEEIQKPSFDEKPGAETEEGHIEQIHGDESTGKPEEEDDSNLSTSAPVISENIPSDSVSGLVTKPHESESAQTDIKIDSTVIPDEYSGIEESIKNNTIQTIITELLHPEEQKPFDVNNLVTLSPETAESQTGDKEGETDNKSEDSEATTATSQDKIFHSPDSTSSSVPIESASSVLRPEDENIIKGQEPEKSDENAAVTTDQGEHLQKPASAESDNIPVQSEGSVTESEQTKPEHPVQTESDDSVIKPDESSSEETPVIPDQSTHIEAEEGQTKPEEPLHVETTAHPGVPESDEAEAVKPEEPSVDTPAVPAEESSIEQQTAEEPSVETQTAETGGDETKLGEPLHGETSVVPEQPSAATEIVETGSKPEESPIESSVLSEHAGSKDSDEGVDKPEEPSTVVQSAAPEQPATEGSEDISTSEYPSVTSSAEDDQVPVESHQMATKPEESSSEIPQQSAQHESESTAQPEVQDGTEKPETSETLESETVETKPEEHTTAETASSLDQQAAIESDHTEQVPEKTSHDETGHQPSPDSNEVAAKPEEVVPFVGIPAIPELPSTIVSDEAESNQEEHIETTALPEQQAPIESEAESTAMEHPASVPSDDISGKPEETPATTEHVSDVESDESTAKPDESPEQTQTLDKTEQPVTAESDESAQKPEEPQEVHSETTDEIPQQPSAVESDDVSIKPEDSVLGLTEIPSLKPHEDTATESIDILKTSEINKPQEVEESSKPEYKPEENIIVSDSEGQDVSGDAHLHPTESSQGEGVTESDQLIQAIKPEEGINQIPEDSVKPEYNKVEDSTEHEAGVLQEHVQSPAVSDETGSEQEIIDATDKPAAEDIEAVTHPTSDVQHEVLITDSENAVATELSEGEKPAEVKPQDEGNIEGTPEMKPETPESNVIHDNEQNVISETNTADPVDNVSEDSHVSPVDTSEQTSESDAATTAKSDISEGPVELDESQKPDTIKESSESTSSEESGASSESDTAAVESSTLQGAVDESPAPSSESQELPTIPEDAQEPEKNIPEGEDTNQIPEQSFDSQSTSQEDTTTDKDQTSVTHVSEDTDKPSKTDIPMPSVDEEPPNPLESDQGELQTHVESNNAEVPIVEDKDPEKHDSETVAPEADESSKPEESTSVNVLPEKVKPDETSESSQHELPVDSENQLHNEKPSAPELVNEPSTGEDALSPNEIPDATVPIHGGAIDIESIAQHLPGPTGILTPESEQGIIPGEGSCLVDDVTYSNNSKIPSSSQCHKECVCISSIVHCIGVDCPPPPHLSNCMPIQQGPDSCCPMYACDGETPTLLESHSQIGDSDSSKQPVKGSDSAPQHETPESPKKPVEIQTVEPAHDESSVTVHGDVVPDHVESDSASSQSVHEPDTSEAVPEKPVDTPEHPLLPALPVPENVEQDFIPEQPSDHEGADVTENQAVSETLPQEEHTETHDSVGEHEIPDSILEQQTSSPEPSDDTKESDKVSDTSGHITESSTTDEKIPETPVTDTSFVQSVPSEESATAVISEEPASIDETAVESKPSEAPEGTPAPTESEVPASPEQPIHDTSSDHEETKPAQEGGEVELPVQSQETPSNVPPSQDTVESTESSEQPASPEESAVTDSIVQHEIASEDISTPIASQEGEQATAESGDTHPLLGVDKPSSVKFESADTELTRPEDSSEPVKSDQESSTVIEAVEPTQQSTVESEQPSVSHEDEVPELPQEAAEDVQQSTDVDSSKLSEVTTPSVDKDEFPEHSGDSHAIVTDANKIDSSAETVHEDATAAQKPEETDISVTQTPVDLGISKPEETSPESVDQEATATQAHSEQPSVSHDATPVDADHAQSISEEFTTYEGDALVTSGPLEDVQHLGTLSPFIPEEAPANADKPEEDVVSEETGKPSEQHPEEEETPSTVGAQHSEEPIYQDGTTETSVHAEAESEVPAALPEGTEGPSKLPEQDGAVQQQTQEETQKPIQEQPAPVDSDVPEETTVPLEDHEPVSPIKTDIPIESHVHEEISKPSEPIMPDEAQKPEEETSKKDEETEKPINESETPVHPEQQLESTSEETLTFEHKPEEPAVTSPAEQIPEEPHTTAEEQTPPRLHVEPKPEEPQITSDEHEPPKADVESKPEVQITSDEHEPPKADAELKPEEPQITSDDHEPPEADTESKPEEPQITTHEQIPSKPEKTDLKPEEPHITSDDQLPTKVDAESKPEEPQISSDEQMLTKVEAELKPEEPHIIGNEQVQTEIKPEEPQVTSDEQAPPKVETDLKPEEPQTTIDEQKPSITDHEPQVTGESGEPSEVKPEEPHQPEQPQITSETTSLEQKPEEPLITTNIDTQPEATIEQKPDSIVPFTQDKVESQHHVTVAPDSVNELHSEHQTLTKPIEHIPGLYPEEDNNYGPLQVPGWTPKPYQPSEHTDEINQQEEHFPSGGDMDYELEEDGPFGPGTCRYGGKVYVSAQQIPRDDPCDFCFCFRSDIICLQQSCPPPIHRCRQESIKGFCCPRYECPVSMATSLNLTTTTTTTTTTLPPHFFAHAYKGAARRQGCQVRGKAYRVGEEIRSASGPCLQCICGADGQMKCDPKVCSPEPMLRKMMEEAISRRRR